MSQPTLDDYRDLCRARGIPGADVRECAGWVHLCTPCGHITIAPGGELWSGGPGDLSARLDRKRAELEHEETRLTERLAETRRALGRE